MNLGSLSIKNLNKAYKEGSLSPVDLVNYYLKNIDDKDFTLNAYIYHDRDRVLEQACMSAERFKTKRSLGPLDGIPIAIKDNIAEKDRPLSCASKALFNNTGLMDASVIEKLKKNGAILMGRTNMDEFAMGSTTRTSAYGPSRNPLDTDLVPGGSSGGSAVAVASKEALIALGTDTGGSVRQPAGFCGIVGYKPSFGSISSYGIVPVDQNFDCVASFSRRVEDSILLSRALKGKDPRDVFSTENPGLDFSFHKPLKDIRFGLVDEIVDLKMEDEVKDSFSKVLDIIEDSAGGLIHLSLPIIKASRRIYNILCASKIYENFKSLREFSYFSSLDYYKNLSDEGLEEAFLSKLGEEVSFRIEKGRYFTEDIRGRMLYQEAQEKKKELAFAFKEAFKVCDVIVSPTNTSLPFKIKDDLNSPKIDMADALTIPANLTGCPSISLPAKKFGPFASTMVTADKFKDDQALSAALALEALVN